MSQLKITGDPAKERKTLVYKGDIRAYNQPHHMGINTASISSVTKKPVYTLTHQ